MKKSILKITVAAMIIVFTGCGGNQQEQTHGEHADMNEAEMPMDQAMDQSTRKMEDGAVMDMQSNISDEQAEKILNAYLELKNALVQTNNEAASNAAGNLIAVISEDADKLAGKIRHSAQQVAGTSGIGEQRKFFSALSDHVYTMVKATDATNATLYRQYCPMAMNNTGAYWLSSEEEIRNPYYGNKMLKCGSVKETIQ